MKGGDDEIVTAVLAGELDVDDPRVGALSTTARAHLDELLKVQQQLANAGSRERELLGQVEARARANGPVPSEVEQFLAGLAKDAKDTNDTNDTNDTKNASTSALLSKSRRLHWRRTAGIAGLAAGLLLLAYSAQSFFAGERPETIRGGRVGSGTLGERADVEPIHPVGEFDAGGAGEELAPFRWKGELPRLARFELRVWSHDESRAGGKDELLAVRELTTGEWRPDLALPDRFHWRVDVLPFEGTARTGPEVEAWKRR